MTGAKLLAGRSRSRAWPALETTAPPPPVDAAVAAARRIAALARRSPDAPYSASQTTRDLAADLAEDLEGTNCSSRLVAELERGL